MCKNESNHKLNTLPRADENNEKLHYHPQTIFTHPVKWHFEIPRHLGGVWRQSTRPRLTCDGRTDGEADRHALKWSYLL